MILVVLSTHAELASATVRGRSYCETGELLVFMYTAYSYANDNDLPMFYQTSTNTQMGLKQFLYSLLRQLCKMMTYSI